MATPRIYILDANVFIESRRRYYAFDICPGFWNGIITHNGHGTLFSIDRIRGELSDGAANDPLRVWAEDPQRDSLFLSTNDAAVANSLTDAVQWVQAHPQFSPQAKAAFVSDPDAWLIAYCKATQRVLVTMEVRDNNIRRKVPIPNVCDALGVEFITKYDMIRELGVQFR